MNPFKRAGQKVDQIIREEIDGPRQREAAEWASMRDATDKAIAALGEQVERMIASGLWPVDKDTEGNQK